MSTNINVDDKENKIESRKIVLFVVLMALFLAAMDATVVGTLLPVLKSEFDQPHLYPWLISGFILSSVIATPVMGLLADRLGAKASMLASLCIFTFSSLWIGIASSMTEIIAARVVQGIGAGGIIVLAYVMIGNMYSDEERGKMQGALSAVWGLAAISGPLLGSLLHASLNWRWAFFINLPFAMLFGLMLAIYYPSSQTKRSSQKLDVSGFITFSIAITAFLLWLMTPSLNLASNVSTLLATATVIAVIILATLLKRNKEASFLAYEFFSTRLSFAALCIVLAASIMYAAIAILPIFLVDLAGFSVLSAGLVVLTASLGWTLGATVCGILLKTLGYRLATAIGFVLLIAGSGLLCLFSATTPLALFALAELLVGGGIGFAATATLILAQNTAPSNRMGVMTAAVQLFRNLGAAIGVNAIAAMQLWLASQAEYRMSESFTLSFAWLFGAAILGLFLALALPNHKKKAK